MELVAVRQGAGLQASRQPAGSDSHGEEAGTAPGVILIPAAVASDLAASYGKDVQWGNGPYTEDGFDKPVDILKGMFGEVRKQDVYYPVRNSDYHKWREKFGRGGDFAIYTELKKVKLPKPIKLTLEETCNPKSRHTENR